MRTELQAAEIKRRLEKGLLPRARRFRTYGGPSLGASCGACGGEIARSGIAYEVDLLDGEADAASRTIIMHADCHVIWLELSNQGSARNIEARPEATSVLERGG